jgi:hypothetical protein
MANPALTAKPSALAFINDCSAVEFGCDLALFCIHDSARKMFPW